MTTSTSLPWYKYPFVWFVLSIPASAVIAGIGMIWLAITTDDGLVADDYYKQGLTINENIERERFAADNKLSADFEYDNELKRVLLKFNKGQLSHYPQTLNFHLEHATRADLDKEVVLMHGQDNQYIGYIKEQMPEGVWHVALSSIQWRIGARINLASQQTIQLLPEVY